MGWGAGAFQYGFTKYKRANPLLDRNRHLQLRWEHLHSDWLECLVEWGVLGFLPLVCLGYGLRDTITASESWRSAEVEILYGAVALVCLQAFFDFPLRNPAVALHMCAVFALASAQLQEFRSNSSKVGSIPGPKGATNSRIC